MTVRTQMYMTSDAQAVARHPPRNAQLAPEQWKRARRATHSPFQALLLYDVIWHGTALWPLLDGCPDFVPSQLLLQFSQSAERWSGGCPH